MAFNRRRGKNPFSETGRKVTKTSMSEDSFGRSRKGCHEEPEKWALWLQCSNGKRDGNGLD